MAGNAGNLITWNINFNEGWTEGNFFAGESVVSGGDVVAQGELRTERGADFVMLNSFGQEVYRIDGQNGAPRMRVVDDQNNLVGDVVFALSESNYLLYNQGIYFLAEVFSNRPYNNSVYYENSNCTGDYVLNTTSYQWSTALPFWDGSRVVRAAGRSTRQIRAASYRNANSGCRTWGPNNHNGLVAEEVASGAEFQALGFRNNGWRFGFGYGD